jgi:uroporphyrin-III C-methyltransferase
VVVVENCSRPDQRILRLALSDLAHGLDTAHGPVLVMIGEALRRRALQGPDDHQAGLQPAQGL